MVWHFRLGHPNFAYLEKLFLVFFKNENPNLFQCEVCQLSKHTRNSFPHQLYKSSRPFIVIHNDVRCPSRIKQGINGLCPSLMTTQD